MIKKFEKSEEKRKEKKRKRIRKSELVRKESKGGLKKGTIQRKESLNSEDS